MIRRHVPNFEDYPEKEQIDFIVRTQAKINEIRNSVEALMTHLEYAAPDKLKALPPLEHPSRNIKAAAFSDVVGTRRAGELLGIPPPRSDEVRNENQTVRKMAKPGRELLREYFGEAEWKTKLQRMRRNRRWWERWESLDDPREQIYALLAKARDSSLEHEKVSAEEDGFDELLAEWVAVAEQRLNALESLSTGNDAAEFDAERRRAARRLLDEQVSIEERDERFGRALSLFDAPPASQP